MQTALARQNADIPGGNVTTGREELTLRTMGRYTDPRGFNDLVIANLGGSPVRLRDVGRVEDGTKEQRSLARLNGVPTVTLSVQRQSGANTIEVIDGVKTALARVTGQLPSDVKTRDHPRPVALHRGGAPRDHRPPRARAASSPRLVVLLFMRSWRSTLIAAVAIPASVVSTFAMMRALDFTLNSVTMLALVLMVGVVIDDAIVVLENIFRFVEEKRMSAMEAAREATADIGLAVLATTLSLVVIFLPVSFMSSISGRFLYQFGITSAVAIMVSLLVSFTLTPMMSSRLLRAEDAASGHGGGHDHGDEHEMGAKSGSRGGFYGYIDRGYTRLLTLSMRHRVAVAVLAILVVASSVPLYRAVKQEFIPSIVDEAEFEVNVNAPEGTNLPVMNETMLAIEKDVMKTPGVRFVLASAGGGFLGGVGQGELYVRIAPHEERTLSFTRVWNELLNGTPLKAFRGNYAQQDVMQEVRRRLRKYAPMRVGVRNAPSFNFGSGGRFDIDFVLRGPELEQLVAYAEDLRDRSEKIGGIVDADTSLKLNKPELRVEIDRERAADLGVSTTDIANSLRVMVGGDTEVTRFQRRLGQRGLRRPAPPDRARPQRPAHARPALRALVARRARPARQPCHGQARNRAVAHRPTRPPAAGLSARVGRARLRARRPHRGAQGRGREHESACHLHDGHLGARPRAGTHVHRVPLGVPALGHLHVHHPGLAVREPDSPGDDSPEPPARHPVRAPLAVGDGRHAESLLGARHPRPLRRGEEELDSSDRPHEQSAREGDGNVSRRSFRGTATACARS